MSEVIRLDCLIGEKWTGAEVEEELSCSAAGRLTADPIRSIDGVLTYSAKIKNWHNIGKKESISNTSHKYKADVAQSHCALFRTGRQKPIMSVFRIHLLIYKTINSLRHESISDLRVH